MQETNLLWGLLFGAIGIGYLLYGRRQRVLIPFLAGAGLVSFPYFVDNTGVLVLVGVILSAVPFVLKT